LILDLRLNLGQSIYATALRLQETLVNSGRRDASPTSSSRRASAVITPTNASAANDRCLSANLLRSAALSSQINRGGDVTFHAPGNRRLSYLDLRSFAPKLESSYVASTRRCSHAHLRHYRIETQRILQTPAFGPFPLRAAPSRGTRTRLCPEGEEAAGGHSSHLLAEWAVLLCLFSRAQDRASGSTSPVESPPTVSPSRTTPLDFFQLIVLRPHKGHLIKFETDWRPRLTRS